MDNFLCSWRIHDLQNPIPPREETVEARWAAGVAPKDLVVLVSAASWRADFLVTGDRKHFDGLKAGSADMSEAKNVSGSAGIPFRIINPAKLVGNVLPEALGEMRASKLL